VVCVSEGVWEGRGVVAKEMRVVAEGRVVDVGLVLGVVIVGVCLVQICVDFLVGGR
jgi:hypothetical protein